MKVMKTSLAWMNCDRLRIVGSQYTFFAWTKQKILGRKPKLCLNKRLLIRQMRWLNQMVRTNRHPWRYRKLRAM